MRIESDFGLENVKIQKGVNYSKFRHSLMTGRARVAVDECSGGCCRCTLLHPGSPVLGHDAQVAPHLLDLRWKLDCLFLADV